MPGQLTPRQLEVAKLAADGHTVEEIAKSIKVSASTARDHLDAVRRKLGVSRKREIGRALRTNDDQEAA
jgi:DNA-binding CsgD family transcriptional regulator